MRYLGSVRFLALAGGLTLSGGLAIAANAGAEERLARIGCDLSSVRTVPNTADALCSKRLEDKTLSSKQRADLLYIRGFGRMIQRRDDAAAKDFADGAALEPENNLFHRQLGYLAYYKGDMRQAFLEARRALELYPKGAEEWLLMGLVYQRNGSPKFLAKALDAYNRALELKPDHAIARYRRAGIELDAKELGPAHADTGWLVRQKPALLRSLGTTELYEKFVDFHQASHARHAQVLAEMGEFAEGERVLSALVADRRTAFSVFAKARYLMTMPVGAGFPSRHEEALALMQEAVKLDPAYSLAWRNLAQGLQVAKRVPEALAANDMAYRTNKSQDSVPDILWERARIYRALGDTEQAIALGTKALEGALQRGSRVAAPYFDRLRRIGYYLSPGMPNRMTEEVKDAATACFIDPTCG